MTSVIHSATFSDATATYVLEPQTTPFVPTETAIFSDLCRSRSIHCETVASRLARGEPCTLADHVDSTTYSDLNDDWYPNNYWLLGYGGTERAFAYPGNACPADLTPACTSTLTLLNTNKKPPYVATVTQIWCCPTAPVGSGPADPGWTCTDKDYDFEKPVSRLCVSLVTETTPAWFTAFKPATTGTGLQAAYETSLIGPEMSLRVYRPVFPLQIGGALDPRSTTEGGTSGTTISRKTTATGTGVLSGAPTSSATGMWTGVNVEGSNSQVLSTGAIAGVVVGCTAFVILMVLMGVGLLLRRRKKSDKGKGKERNVEGGVDWAMEKEVRDMTVAIAPDPGELPTPYNLARAEMGGDERVAELGG